VSATTAAWLALGFPFAGTIVISLLWKVLPGRMPGWIATGALAGSFLMAILALIDLQDHGEEERQLTSSLWTYAQSAGVNVDLGILVDPLSVMMLLVVTGVSMLIHLYSVSYMASDAGHARYFAYLNFFVFSMLVLVLAGNFILLIVGWAFVGAASYLLISFWYRRRTATAAGIKAFVMNVIGDVALVIAAFLFLRELGSLDYLTVFDHAHEASEAGELSTNAGWLVAACVLLLVGAFAKSAQIPLHTWLPDAMEGPTPVSSLIHAATMVTAGVYLIARMHPLFELAPTAADIGAIFGTITLFVAATIAMVQTDLKRVIAYSTMSQIGYMILGVSSFAYFAGTFHLMTHAFFKALLFMGAGSVIGAMAGEQSMDKMGGFKKAMPFTYITFTTGALALAAFPFFSGFFSKDAILAFDINRGGLYLVLAIFGYAAALLTAFYSFRMVFRVFHGDPVPEARELEEGHLHHAEVHRNPATGEEEDTDVGYPGAEHFVAEREWPMKAAMAPLAVLSVIGGVLLIPGVTKTFETFLEPTFAESHYAHEIPSVGTEWALLILGGVVALAGIAGAYWVYMKNHGLTARLIDRFTGLHTFLLNKWYFDELYDAVFVRPGAAIGRFGQNVVESAFVQGVIIGGGTGLVRTATSVARAIQSGYMRVYALVLLAGVAGLTLYFLIVSS
jgi:NADH-quinone oxidoreductase subunit L